MRKVETFKTQESTTHTYECNIDASMVDVEIEHYHARDTFEFTVYGGFDHGDGEAYYSLRDCKNAASEFTKSLQPEKTSR